MLLKSRFVEMFGDPLSPQNKWAKIQLGSVTEVGSSKRIFEKEYVNNGVPFYRTKEIVELASGKEITTELFISEDRYKEIKELYGVPQKGDLLISAVGTIGTIWVVDGKHEFYFKDGNLLRVKHTEKYNPLYLKYLLEQLIAMHKNRMASGTAYAALTISELSKMNIFDVPLEVQNRFEVFIKQLDKLKVILNQIDEKIELLKKSRFVEMFKYVNLSIPQKEWKKISEIGEVIGGSTPKTTEDKYWNGEYKWITPAEIGSETHYINDTERHITEEGINSCSLQKLPIGTVLLTSRAPIGKVAIATSEMFCNQGFKNIVCNSQINPEFLYYLLKHNVEYLNSLGRGATFKEISKSIVENIRIPVPNISDQTAFVSFAKQLDKLKVAIHKELELIG